MEANLPDSQREALDRFLADNPELEKLSARLATFNVFRALRIEREELRHSNTLAWLLDPAESHGLGDVFLRRILSNMLLESGSGIPGLTAAQVELMDFRDIEVRREWRHIDVLVVDWGNKIAVLIENKVGGAEGRGQLSRYRKAVCQELPGFVLVPVFLTLEGTSSEDEESDFIPYSYTRLLGLLAGIVEQRSSQMPESVGWFLADYIKTLRRLTMQEDTLVDLCRTIYRKHRAAIDLIVEYGMTSPFNDVALRIIKEQERCEILWAGQRQVVFLPPSWSPLVPPNGSAWTHLRRRVSIACFADQGKKRAHVYFQVSSMESPELRMACVKALHAAGFKLTKMAFKQDARYSVFYSSSQLVSDWTNEDEIADAMTRLFGKAREQFPKVEAVLRQIFQGAL